MPCGAESTKRGSSRSPNRSKTIHFDLADARLFRDRCSIACRFQEREGVIREEAVAPRFWNGRHGEDRPRHGMIIISGLSFESSHRTLKTRESKRGPGRLLKKPSNFKMGATGSASAGTIGQFPSGTSTGRASGTLSQQAVRAPALAPRNPHRPARRRYCSRRRRKSSVK